MSPTLAPAFRKLPPAQWSVGSLVGVVRPTEIGILHPAIVLEKRASGALVLQGSSDRLFDPHVLVALGTREFASIKVLRNSTFFQSLWLVHADEIYEWAIYLERAYNRGRAPVGVMDTIRSKFQDLIASYDGVPIVPSLSPPSPELVPSKGR